MSETIYEDKQNHICITVDKNYSQEFLDISQGMLWGTEGILYRMKNLDYEFNNLKNPIFVSLKVNSQLAAICALNQKQINCNNSSFTAFYRTVLCANPQLRNYGYATLLVNTITRYLFNIHNKVVIYSFVEEGNKRSRRVLQKANYSQLTRFIAASNVDINPKHNTNTALLSTGDKQNMLALLNNQYANRSFVDINDSFDAASYYVYKENGEIKAGLQIKIASWSFISLIGLEGFLMMKIIPKLPFLKKIFRPDNHTFLKIGNIYIDDSKIFNKLLSSVMFEKKLRTCLVYLSPNANVDSKILKEVKKGIFSSANSAIIMYYKSQNITATEIAQVPFLSIADSF